MQTLGEAQSVLAAQRCSHCPLTQSLPATQGWVAEHEAGGRGAHWPLWHDSLLGQSASVEQPR